MCKVQFSFLSYYPSIVTNENVNVGILFHNLTTDERIFHIVKNWKRLESFDDELDIEFMKKYLSGIKSECEPNLMNNDKKFCLQEYIRFYVNELKFCNIKEADVIDVDDFILTTEKVHMRLDFDKNERLSRDSEVKYIKMMMKSNQVKYSAKAVTGGYNENVQSDYMVGEYGFKNFTFEDKKISNLIMNAKAWAHTAEATKDKYKTIFVYDVEKGESSSYHIIMNILGEHAYKMMPSSEVIDFVIKVQREEDTKNQLVLEWNQ
jgi:hypothetical protein